MAKSRGRKFAELVAPTNGVFAAASIPTIALSKLANSAVTINNESLSLGGSLTLDTSDIGEHTSNKYFTDARAQATLSVASNSGHGALAYDNSSGQFSFAGITTEAIQDVVGAMFSSNTETAVTVNYQDSDGTIDLVVDDTTKVPLAGGTMTGNLTLGDNVNAYFGASTDLRIYHDGTNSHIINSTGELRFSGSNFAIKSDSAKLYLGAGDDLKIYHDGSHSYMTNTGGSLYIRSTSSIQLETDGGVDMLTLGVGGAATLFHNGSAKLATASNGISVTGAISLTEAIYSLDGSGEFSISGDNSSNTYFLSQGEIRFRPSGTTSNKFVIGANGALTINGQYTLPTTDGSANQVLTTDGSGNVSFASVSGSGTITAVVAGTNLTGGATSGSATVNLAGSLTSISKITFTNSNVQAPTTSDATTGARLVLYSNGSGRDYSIGIESDTMWFNSDADYKWYSDGSLKFNWNNTAGQLEIGGNKVWHAGNDGAGSGLDADTVDGIQAASFLRSDAGDTATGNIVFSGATQYFRRNDTTNYTNAPLIVESYGGSSTNTGIGFHISGVLGRYLRMNSSGVLAWEGSTIWHAGNDGTGSGLDADTVDGIQALSFLRSDTNDSVGTDVRHDYGPNSTWSSTLRVGGNGYTAGQNNAFASVVTTNGNLHLDSGGNRSAYLNYYSGTGGTAFGSGSSAVVAWMGPDGDLWKGSADNTGSKYWHAGNDGSGSGLDADTLDGVQGSNFLRTDTSSSVGNINISFTGNPASSNIIRFDNASGQSMNSSTAYLSRLECRQPTAGADAFMTFHVAGDYAAYFGLDGASNDFAVGGWSMGGNKYKIWHQGNDGSGSGLDADTLDGLQGSSYMGYLGMATNRDDYINLRVIRNSGSSAGSNGMYIGYGNAGSGATRLYGGGQTSNHMAVNASNITFSGLSLGSVSMAGTLTITGQSIRSNASSSWDGNPGAQLKIQAHSNRWYIVADSSSNRIVQFRRDGGDVSYIDNAGRLLSQADARAPIFYDEANTGYYLDPAASGTALRTSGSWRQDSTNWTGEINGKIQYHANHWYLQGSGSWHFRNGAGSNGFYVDSSFNSFATGSSRAPIFYDNANTGYYCDPASTSRLVDLKPNRIATQQNVAYGMPRWDFKAYVVESPHHYGTSSTETMYLGEDNTINIRDHGIGEDDLRAPIFYHSTNTTYYVRPGSSSKFAGDIFIDGNYGVGIVGVYSSTRYQHVWMMGSAYRTNASGTSYGNAYGITWTHTNVGTGTNQSISGLSHQMQIRANGTLWCALGQGIWTTGNVTAYSDIAVKTNLEVIPNALEKVCSISGYTYDRTDFVPDPETGEMPETRQAGVVAQEVEKVLPEVVSGEEGNKNVAYGNMVSILIEAIKELKTEVDELKAQLNKEK